jgi:hypothetical protein
MFANASQLVQAATDDGKHWISTFRKALSASATISGQWYDTSYVGGNPIANYYASSPLEAKTLDATKGIIVPRMATGAKQFLHRLTLMSLGGNITLNSSGIAPALLCDYLLYYPFIDMDSPGDDQIMIQTETLPRYEDGRDLQMIVVAQAPTIGGGRFTITYTDANDVLQTTQSMFCAAAQPAGALVQASGAVSGYVAFVPQPAGATGVKRVESVNFSIANGGLCAVVIVRPLETAWIGNGTRRTTTGTLENFGEAVEREALAGRAGIVEIKDGAFLGVLMQGCATSGTLANSVLVGAIETIWS